MIPRLLLRFVNGGTKTPAHLQQKALLLKHLNTARNTQFGQHYNFNEILSASNTVEAFKSTVPIHDYDDMHDQWWHKLHDGSKNITWPTQTKYFALSSGTTGAASKYIPLTRDMMLSQREAGLRLLIDNYRVGAIQLRDLVRDFMMLGGSNAFQAGVVPAGDLSGINLHERPKWLTNYKPGSAILALKSWDDRVQAIAEQAPQWNVSSLYGIPSWIGLMMEEVIKHNKVANIHEVWPNLNYFVSGGINLAPHIQRLNNLLGRPITIIDSYLASEGFVGYQVGNQSHDLQLVTNNGIYFEFIPFDEEHFDEVGKPIDATKTLDLTAVNTTTDYAIIMSTNAGAWRYILGDTIRFTDTSNATFTITGRIKHFLSVCGEHLSVGNMNAGIIQLNQVMELAIEDYTVLAHKKADGTFEHHWYIGLESNQSAEVQAKLDGFLCQLNDDYATERAHLLGLKVHLIPNQTFMDWMAYKNKLGSQHKFPRVLKGALAEEWVSFINK